MKKLIPYEELMKIIKKDKLIAAIAKDRIVEVEKICKRLKFGDTSIKKKTK